MFNESGYSLSDIAAVNRNDGFENSSWWIIILFLFMFCGWGGNGWNQNGSTTREEIAYGFDNNQIQNGIRQLGNGICDSTYALNNAITEGTYKTANILTQGFAGLNSVINDVNNNQTIGQMANFNALQSQLAQCCCDNKAATADLKYTMATDTCAVNTNLANLARDIIDNDNANTRAILEVIQQNKFEAMQEKINELSTRNQTLAFQASQCAQNAYLVDKLMPTPAPAYVVPNPYAYSGCQCS